MGILFDDQPQDVSIFTDFRQLYEHVSTYSIRMPRDRAMSFEIREYGLTVPTVYDMFQCVAPTFVTKMTFNNPYGLYDEETRSDNFPIWYLALDTFQYDGFYQTPPSIKYTIERGDLSITLVTILEFTVQEGTIVWVHKPTKIITSSGDSMCITDADIDLSKSSQQFELERSSLKNDIRAVSACLQL